MQIQNSSSVKILYSTISKYLSDLKSNIFVSYLVVSVFIALYRLIFMWRISPFQFYADEKNWLETSRSHNLITNAFMPDAGYFVPLTRTIFWIVSRFSSSPEIVIHLTGCLLVGFCCSSLILFRNINININKKVIIALCLGLYQSFDLLLWMNLNYYLFIVCCFILFNRMMMKKEIKSNIKNIFTILLMISLGKPQLSLSCCFLLIAVFFMRDFRIKSIRNWYFEICLFTSLLTSILYSRLNSNHLELNLTSENFSFAIAGIFEIPLVLFVPILAIGNAKIAEIVNNSNYQLSSNILSIILSITLFLLLYFKQPKNRKYFQFFSFGIVPLYSSLFVFVNTGWANDYFWNNSCIS